MEVYVENMQADIETKRQEDSKKPGKESGESKWMEVYVGIRQADIAAKRQKDSQKPGKELGESKRMEVCSR
jgi:hypothetical protein